MTSAGVIEGALDDAKLEMIGDSFLKGQRSQRDLKKFMRALRKRTDGLIGRVLEVEREINEQHKLNQALANRVKILESEVLVHRIKELDVLTVESRQKLLEVTAA
jgi:hypothetical protein